MRAQTASTREQDIEYLDAQDASGKWYAAIVKELHPDGGITVHYMGWSPRFDEIIPSDKREGKIAPLYSRSHDRRTWSPEDQIEVKVVEEEGEFGAMWIPATIVEIDTLGGQVRVKYLTSKEKENKWKKGRTGERCSSSDSGDDALKKSSASDRTAAKLAGDLDYMVTKWLGILSDHVCPYGTHYNKKQTVASVARLTSSSSAVAHSLSTPIVPPRSVDDNPSTNPASGGNFVSSISHLFTKPFQSLTSAANYGFSDRHVKGKPNVPGAVGLQNLGNTCFMNSILQCLSNTKPLTDLFFLKHYQKDLNTDNKLGHGGKLASTYAKLVHDMWINEYTKLVPREFKTMIGEFQPQFAGYEQHDSQEFLGFLLDGLHVRICIYNHCDEAAYSPHLSFLLC